MAKSRSSSYTSAWASGSTSASASTSTQKIEKDLPEIDQRDIATKNLNIHKLLELCMKHQKLNMFTTLIQYVTTNQTFIKLMKYASETDICFDEYIEEICNMSTCHKNICLT
mgnify:CR=1 FL=1